MSGFIETFAFLLTGLVSGALGALLGLGGGVFIVPALTLLFHLPLPVAVSSSLIAVVATSCGASATYLRQHLTNVSLALTLELSTTAGAIAGGLVAGLISHDVLFVLFGLIMFFTAYSMLRSARRGQPVGEAVPDGADSLATTTSVDDRSYQIHHWPAGIGVTGLAGMLSGLLGIGGGVIKVPAMYLVMGIPLRAATATSSFMVGVTAVAGAFVYWNRGDVHLLVAASVAFGVYVGATLASRYLQRVHNRFLILLFAVVLFYVGLNMVGAGFHLSLPGLGG